MTRLADLQARIAGCRICADRFAATATAHEPRPVAWFADGARILVAGQAPGLRVHRSGRPFDDPSGQRLRDWMGIDEATFWDRRRIAFLPMALCFPGYNAEGKDLPPPPICAATWRAPVTEALVGVRLTLILGGPALRWHLGPDLTAGGVDATIARWRDMPPATIPLPHPSWRNSGWLNRNPWFATELLPVLRDRVQKALADG